MAGCGTGNSVTSTILGGGHSHLNPSVMSLASEFRDRQRRQRRETARWAFFFVRTIIGTAVFVAVGIWFDLPQRLRGRLFSDGGAAQVVQRQRPDSIDTNRPSAAIRTRNVPEDTIRDAPVQANSSPNEEDAKEPNRERQILPAARKPPPANLGNLITIDLSKKSQTIPLANLGDNASDYPRVRIMGLQRVESKHSISPPDGIIVRRGEVFVSFAERPNARIRLIVVRSGKGWVLRAEPQMSLWADDPMPFTLKTIAHEAHETRRRANQFMAKLEASRVEKEGLVAWIKSPVLKALEARGKARLRVNLLSEQIKRMEGRVESVKEEVQIVGDLERLANLLHKRSMLEFEVLVDQHIPRG